MYIITLILGIIGVVLLAFAIREDEDDRAFPLGILSVVSLICSVMLWCYTDTKHKREQQFQLLLRSILNTSLQLQ